MKLDWKRLLLCLAIPLGVGGLAALLTGGGMGEYSNFIKPPYSPPGWLFPVVWTILYLLMGEASYRVLTSGKEPAAVRNALIAYGVQLALNFIWPLLFFRGQLYLTAFFLLLALWLAILVTLILFSRIDEKAGDLLLPYLLWVTFAGYLNLGVFLLN